MAHRLVEKKIIFIGRKIRLELHHLEDEATHMPMTREVVVHPGAVVILPILSGGGVMLIRNHRYAVGETLLELPAGTLEKNEDPMKCAGRELLEETGLIAGRLQALPSFYSSPGVLTELMYPFVAYNLEKSKQALEEGEEIELQPVAYAEAIAMCRDGRIRDGKTIATLLMHERFFNGPKGNEG